MDKWTGMSISEDKLNGLWCWFVIAFKFLTETYPKNQINHLISIYHMTCSFLMGAFKKCSKTGKNAIYMIKAPEAMSINTFSGRTAWNWKILLWKLPICSNVKLGYWIIMCIFKELWWYFLYADVSQHTVCPKWNHGKKHSLLYTVHGQKDRCTDRWTHITIPCDVPSKGGWMKYRWEWYNFRWMYWHKWRP